jgi:hypothetical protein
LLVFLAKLAEPVTQPGYEHKIGWMHWGPILGWSWMMGRTIDGSGGVTKIPTPNLRAEDFTRIASDGLDAIEFSLRALGIQMPRLSPRCSDAATLTVICNSYV